MTVYPTMDEAIIFLDEVIEREINKSQTEPGIVITQEGWRIDFGSPNRSCLLTTNYGPRTSRAKSRTVAEIVLDRREVAKVIIYENGRLDIKSLEQEFNPLVVAIGTGYKNNFRRADTEIVEV